MQSAYKNNTLEIKDLLLVQHTSFTILRVNVIKHTLGLSFPGNQILLEFHQILHNVHTDHLSPENKTKV